MRITLIIFLIGISITVKSQNYTPLPTDSAEWFVEIEGPHGDGGETTYNKYRYFIGGDTTINDTLYIEIFCESSNYIRSEGYLYQDTVQQKVYFTQLHWDQDLLLYDFSLEVGQSCEFEGFGNLKVESVDSIIINDSYRRRIIFEKYIICDPNYGKLNFIEGVGSNAGLFPENYLGAIVSLLTCYQETDETLYPIDVHEYGCDINTIIINEINNVEFQDVSIFPNPFNDIISIDLKLLNLDNVTLKVFDLQGKLVFFEKTRTYDTNNIDLSFLNNGIYLLKVEKGNINILSKTILKE